MYVVKIEIKIDDKTFSRKCEKIIVLSRFEIFLSSNTRLTRKSNCVPKVASMAGIGF